MILILNSCKKKPSQPILTTESVSSITQTSAVSGGNVIDNGGVSVVERGVCWNTSGDPTVRHDRTIEDGESGSFTSTLSGLTANTLYYVRAYATNEIGTGYGNQVTFKTLPVLSLALTTREVASITATAAVSGGNITDDGGGIITVKGVCWATTENPTINHSKTTDGSGTGLYNSYLTGLASVTIYYIRAYATNSAGTTYGNQLSFTTTVTKSNPIIFNPDLTYNLVSDIDGNSYKTIQIGTQIWMAENLKSTKYSDGSIISNIIDDESWNTIVTGAYCWFNNDISNKDVYGVLYNWYAVSTGKLCPAGWHIPGHTEWLYMISHIGGVSVGGGRMKEAGSSHWLSPNTGATNESGFTALPGGIRTVSGYFQGIGSTGRWWKSTEGDVIEVSYDSGEVKIDAGCVYRRGLSVRCLKD
jgi:uncharacterized protein (TIGR02145 family)